jgi:SAM-dependent methyltransferase
MSFTLNLPYAACYPLTQLARRIRRPARHQENDDEENDDQAAYFERQYRDTANRYKLHMGDLDLVGKTVLDVGSGLGGRALGWLELGAGTVINIDINRQELNAGRAILDERYSRAAKQIVYRHPDEMTAAEQGDVAISFDSFEHLVDPAEVLRQLNGWLRPGGLVWIGSIGWYHYMASHCTGAHIPIPWCQVFFSETAIIKTIRRLLRSPRYVPNDWERREGLGRWDKVTTLKDRPGEPLNMLSLRQIRRVLKDSSFELLQFRVFGFSGRANKLARLLSPLSKVPVLRELVHSYYTALLIKHA